MSGVMGSDESAASRAFSTTSSQQPSHAFHFGSVGLLRTGDHREQQHGRGESQRLHRVAPHGDPTPTSSENDVDSGADVQARQVDRIEVDPVGAKVALRPLVPRFDREVQAAVQLDVRAAKDVRTRLQPLDSNRSVKTERST